MLPPRTSAARASRQLLDGHGREQLLDLTIRREYGPDDKRQRDACLLDPRTGLEICLVEYSSGPQEPFNEFSPGLDHLGNLYQR